MARKLSFHTGEFAKIVGVNKRTLHYYDEEGIFRPAHVEPNGYRSYSFQQFYPFYMLRHFRSMGLDLAEIKEYMEHRSPARLDALLTEQQAWLTGEMERLRVSSRVHYKSGDALELAPLRVPDAILVDAPCSGSGTWRRHPEGKWRLSPEALDELCALQERLLERACSLVKAGGKVVYSTCSLLACENERVVRAVLGRHPEMLEQPAAEADAMTPRACGGAILPADPWTDGFYLAVLHKEPN